MKKKIQQTEKQPAKTASTPKLVYLGVLIILLLSGLQFILILTLGDDTLKPLERDRVYPLTVTRVVDLNFPALSREAFATYLTTLSNAIRTRLGYRVNFTVRKTVLVENYISADDMLFGSRAARKWFAQYNAAEPCWEGRDFAWLDSILARPADLRILKKRYGGGPGLRERVKQDFLRRFRKLLAIRDRAGRLVYRKKACFRAASICWAWLLSSQISSDFVVTNSPVFFPSALTPVDAVTRGGLLLSFITPSKRQLQGVLALSFYPLLKLDAEKRIRISLQGFARLLDRKPLSLQDPDGLLYPVFGGREAAWSSRQRGYLTSSIGTIKKF